MPAHPSNEIKSLLPLSDESKALALLPALLPVAFAVFGKGRCFNYGSITNETCMSTSAQKRK